MTNGKVVAFRLSPEVHALLAHHAKRLGMDMNVIAKQGTIELLERLDEKEAIAREARRAQERKGAVVGAVPEHRWGDVPGLGPRRETPPSPFAKVPAATFAVPEKMTKNFRRWAEYIEDAEDRSDGERRAKVVLADMRDKCNIDAEATVCFDKFNQFMQERAAAKEKPDTGVKLLDENVVIEGDV
jgi:hypothetical protein